MLSEIIKTGREEKKLTIENLQEQTNIPIKHLNALESEDFSDLPAPVFIRGYLQKISRALKLNSDELWQEFSNDFKKSKTTTADALPKNRFEQSKKLRYWPLKFIRILPTIVIGVAVIGFVLLQAKSLLGPPRLKLISPAIDLVTNEETISVEGYGPSNSYITINGKEIYLTKDGHFNETITLNPGLNEIKVEAHNRLNKTSVETRRIFKE